MDLKPSIVYILNSLIAGVIVFALIATAASKGERIPGRLQNFFEWALDGLRGIFMGALGEGGERHLPLIYTLFFYILIGNFLGFVPALTSPTAATSTTMALGIIVFVYVQYVGIKAKGVLGYLGHFLGPVLPLVWLFLPIEIIGELAKPFSLAMRLFGNIFGEDKIVDVIFKAQGEPLSGQAPTFGMIVMHLLPLQFLVNCLQAFTNIVQAFIFSLLTCAYIAIMTQGHNDEGDAHDPHPHMMDVGEKMKDSMVGLGGNL